MKSNRSVLLVALILSLLYQPIYGFLTELLYMQSILSENIYPFYAFTLLFFALYFGWFLYIEGCLFLKALKKAVDLYQFLLIFIVLELFSFLFHYISISQDEISISLNLTSISFSHFILPFVIISPIIEEIIYRFISIEVLDKVTGNNLFLLLSISSFSFGLIHLPNVGLVLLNIGIGLILGYAYIKNKSIIFVVLLHSLHNLIQGIIIL